MMLHVKRGSSAAAAATEQSNRWCRTIATLPAEHTVPAQCAQPSLICSKVPKNVTEPIIMCSQAHSTRRLVHPSRSVALPSLAQYWCGQLPLVTCHTGAVACGSSTCAGPKWCIVMNVQNSRYAGCQDAAYHLQLQDNCLYLSPLKSTGQACQSNPVYIIDIKHTQSIVIEQGRRNERLHERSTMDEDATIAICACQAQI